VPDKLPTADLITNCRQRLKVLHHLADQDGIGAGLRRQLHWRLTRQYYRLALLHLMGRIERTTGDDFDQHLSLMLDCCQMLLDWVEEWRCAC